jgi:protein-L-isoaspartate(D-aspartate) O-methyltransferase
MIDTDALRKARTEMVERQLIPRGIKDARVLAAMRKVPRHVFVDGPMENRAYDDAALPIGSGQTISQPYMVAVMTELLGLQGDEKVLEIGTGSGYQAAVLAELAAEVYTIERLESLADYARSRHRLLSIENVHVRVGDGTLGWPEAAPFDRIIITAASPDVPPPLTEQLAAGGTMVLPVGSRYSQELLRIRKTGDALVRDYHTPCVFVPLIGAYGWKGDK